jgi:hypothetical protein
MSHPDLIEPSVSHLVPLAQAGTPPAYINSAASTPGAFPLLGSLPPPGACVARFGQLLSVSTGIWHQLEEENPSITKRRAAPSNWSGGRGFLRCVPLRSGSLVCVSCIVPPSFTCIHLPSPPPSQLHRLSLSAPPIRSLVRYLRLCYLRLSPCPSSPLCPPLDK